MKTIKLGAVVLIFAMLALMAVLGIRARNREIQLTGLENKLNDLRVQSQQLATPTAVASAPAKETGFYRAQPEPGVGYRRMILTANGTEKKTEILYVALLPDLITADFANAVKVRGGLNIKLNPSGQARVQTLSRERTKGGRVGREAILVDGEIVAAPIYREEIQGGGLMIAGTDDAAWPNSLIAEIAATNNGDTP